MTTSSKNESGVFYTPPALIHHITEMLSGEKGPADRPAALLDLVTANPPFGGSDKSGSSLR